MTTETLNFPVFQNDAALTADAVESPDDQTVGDVTAASDFELAQAAAKGNMMAFEEIYQRHHRRVYSICLRM
ncbi:MAG TPA: hypothetical protein VL327_00090, partial [Pyrinomonadaceae bacterium]|nr:hypothetical protein [Pyrinomonadaceae bacterium]